MPHLSAADPDVAKLIKAEILRQQEGLELIASENIVSEVVLEVLGTPLANKYSEGYPGKRYYGGNEIIDKIETLAIERAKKLFGADHANVQPHSGSQANQAAYLAFLAPGDPVLAMDLAHGGHLTHGSRVNASGKTYRFTHYGVDPKTELLDMDAVRAIALREQPKVIVAGHSAYARTLDFAAFRKIADEVGAKLIVDMAHFAGLVAAKLHPDPIPYADVVTLTTHKTLRGPRGGMILCRTEHAKAIDSAVFPGMQGGPLEHVIAAKAVALGEALQPSFAVYQKQVLANAKALASSLTEAGFRIVTGGTDNHLMLVDLAGNPSGGAAEKALEAVGISANKNMIPFDTRKPMDPSGLRLGTPSITTRGFDEATTRALGSLMAKVFKNPESAAVRKSVSAEVKKLCAAHPIYPGLTTL